MGHHSGHFALVAGGLDHSAVDVHWTTGKCKGIDIARVYNFEIVLEFRMLKLARDCTNQTPSDAFHITSNLFIAKQRELLFNFLSCLSTKLCVVLSFVFITVICDLCLGYQGKRHRQQRDERQPNNKSLLSISSRSNHRSLQLNNLSFYEF